MKGRIGWMVCFVWLLLWVGGMAEEQSLSGPPSRPVEVRVGVYLLDVIAIDGSAQTFTADVVSKFSWVDPRLASPNAGVRKYALSEIWSPRLLVSNSRDLDPRWPEEVEVDPTGKVVYRQRSISTFACPLNLRSFPHDQQDLFVTVMGIGLGPDELHFVVDEEATGSSKSFTITDWSIGDFTFRSDVYQVPGLDQQVPRLQLKFKATRLTQYYMGTIFATVAIIASMAWLPYWLPVSAINPRISVSVTSMLSLIAYRFVAGQDLPRLPYLTSMDYFLLGAALLILVGLMTIIVVGIQESRGRDRLAARLNSWFRWLYPVILGGLLLSLARA